MPKKPPIDDAWAEFFKIALSGSALMNMSAWQIVEQAAAIADKAIEMMNKRESEG